MDSDRDPADNLTPPRASPGAAGSSRPVAIAGALLAGLGVALGAFGAHGLRATLEPQALGWWQTGVDYQMWHALALVALAALRGVRTGVPALLIGSGTLIFSGSLYLLALGGGRWLGMVTPLGGLLMIAGWALLAWRCASSR